MVLIQEDTTHALGTAAHLAGDSNTHEIPVVVLTPALHSFDAHRARAAGCVTLLPNSADIEVLLGEVDTLIPDASHAKRTLKRRLLDLQELARLYRLEEDGPARLRRLIDHLQIPTLGVDASGLCIAASEGATRLTGYSRLQLQTPSVFQSAFRRVGREEAADARTTTITTRTGEDVMATPQRLRRSCLASMSRPLPPRARESIPTPMVIAAARRGNERRQPATRCLLKANHQRLQGVRVSADSGLSTRL